MFTSPIQPSLPPLPAPTALEIPGILHLHFQEKKRFDPQIKETSVVTVSWENAGRLLLATHVKLTKRKNRTIRHGWESLIQSGAN